MNYTKQDLKDLVYQVNGAAIEVHKSLGPGLLESVYHKCLKHELELRKINFQSELLIPIQYKGIEVNAELRCDFLIEEKLVVELKSVTEMKPIFEAQILSYMNLLKIPIGLLINFNVTNIYKEGQKTYINNLYNQIWD
ncbi:GxxExxY protein [Flavobacterium piscinae]|uniref:GxxExxY protein n=1 Tax=Flavobacterium piscinae TaxID=2506424 RepID=A0A4Q1KU19_9FLAO|nr:GxxExxY protein [Flavobacterium piscinae]MBC8883624.1 GxxExxY protein [Flavobacterium piscinae]RXR33683.1 GxxExxY protein [Flavobacterium piscinae]